MCENKDMRVTPIKQDIYLAKNKLKTGAKKVERQVEKRIPQKVLEKMPKKLTWNLLLEPDKSLYANFIASTATSGFIYFLFLSFSKQ